MVSLSTDDVRDETAVPIVVCVYLYYYSPSHFLFFMSRNRSRSNQREAADGDEEVKTAPRRGTKNKRAVVIDDIEASQDPGAVAPLSPVHEEKRQAKTKKTTKGTKVPAVEPAPPAPAAVPSAADVLLDSISSSSSSSSSSHPSGKTWKCPSCDDDVSTDKLTCGCGKANPSLGDTYGSSSSSSSSSVSASLSSTSSGLASIPSTRKPPSQRESKLEAKNSNDDDDLDKELGSMAELPVSSSSSSSSPSLSSMALIPSSRQIKAAKTLNGFDIDVIENALRDRPGAPYFDTIMASDLMVMRSDEDPLTSDPGDVDFRYKKNPKAAVFYNFRAFSQPSHFFGFLCSSPLLLVTRAKTTVFGNWAIAQETPHEFDQKEIFRATRSITFSLNDADYEDPRYAPLRPSMIKFRDAHLHGIVWRRFHESFVSRNLHRFVKEAKDAYRVDKAKAVSKVHQDHSNKMEVLEDITDKVRREKRKAEYDTKRDKELADIEATEKQKIFEKFVLNHGWAVINTTGVRDKRPYESGLAWKPTGQDFITVKCDLYRNASKDEQKAIDDAKLEQRFLAEYRRSGKCIPFSELPKAIQEGTDIDRTVFHESLGRTSKKYKVRLPAKFPQRFVMRDLANPGVELDPNTAQIKAGAIASFVYEARVMVADKKKDHVRVHFNLKEYNSFARGFGTPRTSTYRPKEYDPIPGAERTIETDDIGMLPLLMERDDLSAMIRRIKAPINDDMDEEDDDGSVGIGGGGGGQKRLEAPK